MAFESDFRDQVYQIFFQRALKFLQEIQKGLLEFSQNPSSNIHTIMRAAYNLKRGAAYLGLVDVKRLAHRLNNIFQALRQQAEIDAELINLLLQAQDCLQSLFAQIKYEADIILARAQPAFAQLENRLGHVLQRFPEFITLDRILLPLQTNFEVGETLGQSYLAGFRTAPATVLTSNEDQVDGMDIYPAGVARILKTAQCFVWMADSIAFFLPYDSIEEHLAFQADQIIQFQNQRFLHRRDHLLPIYSLSNLLQDNLPTKTISAKANQAQHRVMLRLAIRQEHRFIVLESTIDRLVTEPELVIHPPRVASPLPSYLYGYTRSNYNLVPVIDIVELLNQRVGCQAKMVSSVTSSLNLSATWVGNETDPQMTAAINVSEVTVLVIDDSVVVREILTFTLQAVGYQVLQAQNGQEALEQLQQDSRVKLVVCDAEMPQLDGFEFLICCRQDPLLAKVPVVMLSDLSNAGYQRLALELGVAAYLSKPYKEKNFLATLKTILDSVED